MLSLNYVKAGNATFTIENSDGVYVTFNVKKQEFDDGARIMYFVKVKDGHEMVYLGTMQEVEVGKRYQVKHTRASRFPTNHEFFQIFDFALRMVTGIQPCPEGYKVHHEGTCGMCARPLTTPESIELGLGPVCAGRM